MLSIFIGCRPLCLYLCQIFYHVEQTLHRLSNYSLLNLAVPNRGLLKSSPLAVVQLISDSFSFFLYIF